MNKRFLIVFILILACNLLAVDFEVAAAEKDGLKIVYFYMNACSSCQDAEKFIDDLYADLKKQGYNITFARYNTFKHENLELLNKYFEAYKVPNKDRVVPIIFAGEAFLSGEEDIKAGLGNAVVENTGKITPGPKDLEGMSNKASGIFAPKLLTVFLAGLVGGINPCSMSMVLFLLSILLMKKANIIKAGLAFCAGKFIAYFLLGTVFYKILEYFNPIGYKFYFNLLIIVVSVILILLNLKDFLAAKGEHYERIKLQLPGSLRKANHLLIKRLSGINNLKLIVPASFAVGLGISLFEFLCTGQIYMATLVYVMKNSRELNLQALISFVAYIAAFLIPLLCMIIVVHFGKEVFEVSEAIRKRLPVIKLINAILFFIFALIMLYII